MPLIPNYIARLRTHSQSTAASSSTNSASRSNSTAGPSTPGSELVRLAVDPLIEQPEPQHKTDPAPPQVARKIHPNPSALVDKGVPQEDVVDDLRPRPPRGPSQSAEHRTLVVSQTKDEHGAEHVPSTASSSIPPRSQLLSRILSAPLLSGVLSTSSSENSAKPDSSGISQWSTFGRRRPLSSAVGEFGSLHRSGSGSKSSAHSKSSRHQPQQKSATATPSTTRPPSTAAPTSTPSRAQTTEAVPSQQNSPAGTVSSSSKSHSQSGRSHSLRSRRPPLLLPEPIPDTEPILHPDPPTPASARVHASFTTPSPVAASPPSARSTLDDSPHTFGRGTPKGINPTSSAYPQFGSAFVPSKNDLRSPDKYHGGHVRNEPPATFPQRKRARSRPAIGNSISFPSLPSKDAALGLHVEDELQVDDRRWSASWSAAEAVKSGDGSQGETWPATVSREIVRLSLRGHGSAVREELFALSEVGASVDGHFKNAMLFGSTGDDRSRFMKAGRRRTNLASAGAAQSSSSVLQKSMLQPAFSAPSSTGVSLTSHNAAGEKSHEGLLAPHVSITAPTPSPGTISYPAPKSHIDTLRQSQGKRKIADTEGGESVGQPKTSLLNGGRDSSNRVSDASHAPSSFRQSKRIRLSTPSHSPKHLSRTQSQSSRLSPPGSPNSRPPSALRALPTNSRNVSQTSIPLRAIVYPRPPSIDRQSVYHMRDPALPPPRRQSTQWAGSARKSQSEGRRPFPLQGWAFVLGFVLFPIWWIAAVIPVRWGWRLHSPENQDAKGAQPREEGMEMREIWEYDVASVWRRRCRLMSILGLLVYTPLIVLLVVLVPRP